MGQGDQPKANGGGLVKLVHDLALGYVYAQEVSWGTMYLCAAHTMSAR